MFTCDQHDLKIDAKKFYCHKCCYTKKCCQLDSGTDVEHGIAPELVGRDLQRLVLDDDIADASDKVGVCLPALEHFHAAIQ